MSSGIPAASPTLTQQLTERVLGKPGSIGEIRAPGKSSRRHLVQIAWRHEDGQPVLAAVACWSGRVPCAGFGYRRTCSHAEAALDLLRRERARFGGRDVVATGRAKPMAAPEEEALDHEIDDPDLIDALDLIER